MTAEQIAMVCHEANRAYCQTLGDQSQKPWPDAEQWQRDSAIAGVQFKLRNPQAPPSAQHEQWLAEKRAQGWIYGAVKNAATKEHPCFLPYEKLPEEQKVKDDLFGAIVNTLR